MFWVIAVCNDLLIGIPVGLQFKISNHLIFSWLLFYFVVLLWNKIQLRIANQPHRYFAKLNKEIIFVPVSFRQAYIKFMY